MVASESLVEIRAIGRCETGNIKHAVMRGCIGKNHIVEFIRLEYYRSCRIGIGSERRMRHITLVDTIEIAQDNDTHTGYGNA